MMGIAIRRLMVDTVLELCIHLGHWEYLQEKGWTMDDAGKDLEDVNCNATVSSTTPGRYSQLHRFVYCSTS